MRVSKLKWFSLSLIFVFLLLDVSDVEAQTRKRKKKKRRPVDKEEEYEEKVKFTDNITYDILIGNLSVGSSFFVSAKPTASYKFAKFASAGLGFKINYTYYNLIGEDISETHYGLGAHLKLILSDNFYLKGEYAFMRYDLIDFRVSHDYPLFGLGYLSGIDRWKYGVELMFIADDFARETERAALEYWINFSYSF